MKILCDENNFIIAATTDNNTLIASTGQYIETVSDEYLELQLYEIQHAYPLYKFSNGNVVLVNDIGDYSVNLDYLKKAISKLRVGFNDIIEASVLTEYEDSDTIRLSSGFVGIKSIISSNNSDTVLSFINGDIEAGATKKANTWYYVYVRIDLSDPSSFKGFISETPPSKDRFGNDVSSGRNGERYHPTLEARFRGSFKTDSAGNIIAHKRVGDRVSYQGSDKYIAQGVQSNQGSLLNCRSFVPITSSVGSFVIESDGRHNSNLFQEIGSSIDNYSFRVRRGNSGSADIAIENDSIAYRTRGTNVNISVAGYYEGV